MTCQASRLTATNRAFIYEGGSWTEVAPMVNPRAQHAAALLPDGRVLVAGGSIDASNYFLYTSPNALACAEIYDPQTDTWTEVMTCDEDTTSASLPDQTTRPGYDSDTSYGVLIAGGYDRGGYAVTTTAYFVGQPDL